LTLLRKPEVNVIATEKTQGELKREIGREEESEKGVSTGSPKGRRIATKKGETSNRENNTTGMKRGKAGV